MVERARLAGWAGIFTETGESGSQRTQSGSVVRVSGSTRLGGLCGLALSVEWLPWMETFLAASMTGKIAIGKKTNQDGMAACFF